MFNLFFVFIVTSALQIMNCEVTHFPQQQQQQHFVRKEGMASMQDVTQLENRINSDLADLRRKLAIVKEHLEVQRSRKLEAAVDEIIEQKLAGAVFIRWGRKDCPSNTSTLLYSGMVGGSFWDHGGGATTFLCLPKNPQRLRNLSVRRTQAYLVAGVYGGNEFGPNLSHSRIACAVCQSKTGSQKMMIPARIGCLPGWTKQYAGYLGTGSYQHSPKPYICINEDPEVAAKGFGNRQSFYSAMLYSVKVGCGGLLCPPFQGGDSVTCVVCTK